MGVANIRLLTGFFALLISITACKNKAESTPQYNNDTIPPALHADMSIPGSFTPPTRLVFDSTAIQTFIDSFPQFSPMKQELTKFYQGRNYSYAWFDSKGMIEPADNLYNRMMNIEAEGLPDKVLYKTNFRHLMDTEADQKKLSPSLDLMLTTQYLSYANLVWSGLSKQKLASLNWYLPRKETPVKALLDSLLTGKDILTNAPVFRQYELLKSYLKKYHIIQKSGGWPKIISDKKNYSTGDSSATIAQVRQHLFITGDLQVNNNSGSFDDDLAQAIRNYQRRFGYTETGILTATLMADMNQPVEKRIEQIVVNMERCRWVPVQLNSNYLLINIPDYKLYVYEKDSLAWSMNVVVGKNQHKTVVFNGDMKYVVFSPYWNIPSSILKNETLPAIRRNRNYLAKHNMEWNGGQVRQKPGPNNSLGLVKFLFPNSHSIYLHDTPAKSLFSEDKRAFSHGCIRLAEPKKLAQYLLRNDTSWTDEKITAAMNAGKEQYVTLKEPVPVFIAYFTSWVDRSGKINFRYDVYDRDARLAKMILEKTTL